MIVIARVRHVHVPHVACGRLAYANPQKSKNLASAKIHQFNSYYILVFDMKNINKGIPVTVFAGTLTFTKTSNRRM
jgi:hypothetical protein